METYTLREAAGLTGTSQEALRKRVDRGTIRSVKRAGVRRIPRSELERAGLRIGEPADANDIVRELTEKIDAQAQELARLRALPERVEEYRRQADVEAKARQEAEALARVESDGREAAEREREAEREARVRVEAERRAADEQLKRFAAAGWRERRRLLRELRAQRTV